jgi:hypothetical protein
MAHQFREGILPMRRIKKKKLKAAVDQQLTQLNSCKVTTCMRHGTNFAKSCHIIRQRFDISLDDALFMHRR